LVFSLVLVVQEIVGMTKPTIIKYMISQLWSQEKYNSGSEAGRRGRDRRRRLKVADSGLGHES
jgi:hypothetical protein